MSQLRQAVADGSMTRAAAVAVAAESSAALVKKLERSLDLLAEMQAKAAAKAAQAEGGAA
jgi:hypothetical protein